MAIDAGTLTIDVAPDVRNFGRNLSGALGSGSTLRLITAAGVAVGAALGVALGGAAVAAFNVGRTIDEAFDTIRVGTGSTGVALEGLKDDFRAVGATSASELGDVGTAIAGLNTRLGLTGEPLQEMAQQFLDLSRITGTDLESNISGITRVFGDWDIATGDQSETLDQLFRASQASGAGIDQLSGQVVQFGAPLRQLGFTFEESIGLLASFEREGVNTELVMGSMRVALGKMARAGEEPIETFNRVVSEIEALGPGAEASGLALELFGARAGPDMAAAITEGRFAAEDLVDTIINGSDTIADASADTDSFAQSWQRFKNQAMLALEPVAMRVFEAVGQLMERLGPQLAGVVQRAAEWFETRLLPALASAAAFVRDRVVPAFQTVVAFIAGTLVPAFREHLLPVFQRLADWWAENGPGIRDYIAASLGQAAEFIRDTVVPAVRDQLLPAFERFAAFVRDELVPAVREHLLPVVQAVVAWIGEHLNPILVVAGAVGAVLVAGVLALVGAFVIVVGPIVALVAALTGFIAAIKWTVKESVKAWTRIRDFVTGAVSAVRDRITAVTVAVRVTWARFWDAVRTKTAVTWDAVKTKVATTIDAVRTKIANVTAALKTAWARFWDDARTKVATTWEAVKTKVATTIDEVRTKIVNVHAALKTAWNTFWDNARTKVAETWAAVKDRVSTTIDEVKTKIGGVTGAIKTAWNTFWDDAKTKVNETWDAVRTKVDTVTTNVATFVTDLISDIKTPFATFWDGVKTKVAETWDAVGTKVDTVTGNVTTFVTDLISDVKTPWVTFWDEVGGKVAAIGDAMVNFISAPGTGLHARMVAAFSNMVDGIGAAWDRVKGVVRAPIAFIADNVYGPFRNAVNSVASTLGLSLSLPAMTIPTFHSGGVVGEPGQRTGGTLKPGEELIKAQKGEGVLPRHVMDMLGRDRFTALQSGTFDEDELPANARGNVFPPAGLLDTLASLAGSAIDAGRQLIADVARPAIEAALANLGDLGGGLIGDIGGAAMRRLGAGALDWLAGVETALEALVGTAGELTGDAFSKGGGYGGRVAGRLSANTADAVAYIRGRWGLNNIGTIGGRPGPSDHPYGKALDAMVHSNSRMGTEIARHFVRNPQQFGTKYVIWYDQINSGSGWRPYSHYLDPAGLNDTLAHRDHPHVSFLADGGYVTSPTYAMVGEAGPEIVAPEDKLEEIFTRVLARAGRTAVNIERAEFNDGVDVELLLRKAEFAVSAGSL